ncbi:hypothetical protein LMH87_000029 [Akanthomyces muscarius]|uniref:B-(1-6) glucan synthase n=1 Tax=Akanthomyces muscarius TaxID=2231603 RepID=A0A9W8QE84_AKAMU|nr:hypothetical protein LMH87_000029 [Akanthomyces muscarius]KAJ4154750.1 hypothetical protein LMH87_000029 [Akanthomyces muscarius]
MLSSLILAATAAIPAAASVIQRDAPNCFPYGSAKLPGNLQPPSVSHEKWWCSQDMAYGFQGFSYPLENDDCNAWENGYDAMDKDFKQMKKDFGASIVRMYYPTCTKPAVFEHALEAAYNNNMAVVFQVWTNFGGGDVWKQSQQAIYDVLNNSKYKAIAPYVVHSAEFGSEPVGDGMDGDNFVTDLGRFRKTLNGHQIPVGISEDWDRPGKMSSNDGKSLGPIGKGVKANSDVAHIHPMPFYHDYNGKVDAAWPYIQKQTQWVVDHVGLPTMISETQWAWGKTDHNPGKADVGPQQYIKYWKTIDNNCEWFRDRKVGWFFHAWRGEDTFDIVKPDGSYAIPNWRPRKC